MDEKKAFHNRQVGVLSTPPSVECNPSVAAEASSFRHKCFYSTKRRPSGPLRSIPVALRDTEIGPMGSDSHMNGMDCIGAVRRFALQSMIPPFHCGRPTKRGFGIGKFTSQILKFEKFLMHSDLMSVQQSATKSISGARYATHKLLRTENRPVNLAY